MIWGGISNYVKARLIVIAGNLTAVRYSDEVFRPVSARIVKQHQLVIVGPRSLGDLYYFKVQVFHVGSTF